MSSLAWFEVWTLGLPAGYLVGLLLRRRRQVRRAALTRSNRSVVAITARVERERQEAQAAQAVRWPRADPDRRVVRDERPTEVLPRIADNQLRERLEREL